METLRKEITQSIEPEKTETCTEEQFNGIDTHPKILTSFCKINLSLERNVNPFSSRMMVIDRA